MTSIGAKNVTGMRVSVIMNTNAKMSISPLDAWAGQPPVSCKRCRPHLARVPTIWRKSRLDRPPDRHLRIRRGQ